MKQKDIALIVVVGILAAVVSLLLTQQLFVSKKNRELSAEKVEKISAEFKTPEAGDNVFNDQAINPTQLIQIGDSANTNPF